MTCDWVFIGGLIWAYWLPWVVGLVRLGFGFLGFDVHGLCLGWLVGFARVFLGLVVV